MNSKQSAVSRATIEEDFSQIEFLVDFLEDSSKSSEEKMNCYFRYFKEYERAYSRALFCCSVALNENSADSSVKNKLNKILDCEKIVKKFQYTVIKPFMKKEPDAVCRDRKISASLRRHLAFIEHTEYSEINEKLFQACMVARSIMKNTAGKTPEQTAKLEKLIIDIKTEQLAQIPPAQKANATALFFRFLGLNKSSVAVMVETILQNNSSVKNYLMQQQGDCCNLRELFNIKSNISFSTPKLILCVEKLFYTLSPEFSQLIEQFFRNNYVELQAGPYPGGWHIGCPSLQQSRIFLAVQNSLTDVFNLSHELGHAYTSFQQGKADCNSTSLTTIEYGAIFCELYSYVWMSETFPEYAEEIQKLLKARLLKYIFVPLEQYLFENYLIDTLQAGEKKPDFPKLTARAWQQIFGKTDNYFTDISERHTEIPQYFSVYPFYSLSYSYSFFAAFYSFKKLQEDKSFMKKINEVCSSLGYLTVPQMYKMLGIDINSPAFYKEIICSITKD